jgi:hypothetical protein
MLSKLTIGIAVLVSGANASEPPREVNICKLIRLASQLDGKVIQVRGLLRNSDTPEDPSFDELVPESCPDAEGRRTVIHIVSPDAHFLAHSPQGYKPDMDSIRRAEPTLNKAAADARLVSATIEGVLQAVRPQSARAPRHKQYSAVIVIQALREAKER